LQEQIDLVVVTEEKPQSRGISIAIGVSLVLHVLLLILFVRAYRPRPPVASEVPISRYVELISQNPQDKKFTEAPGPKIEQSPLSAAPLSDANRKASMPNPTGQRPTMRPGDGGGLYTPPSNPAPRGPRQAQAAPQQQQAAGAPSQAQPSQQQPQQTVDSDRLIYREQTSKSSSGNSVDWKSALREVKVASLGGGDGLDLGQLQGGEKGFAEQGPISFETSWYDWGPYAQSMVSRIRVNWYANMPQIIRTGLKGQVTIRFTIQRDGRITDIEILKSSGVPPYDYAAKKAIELSSPLNPLPKDFPNPSERVTCLFYYNMEIPTE
jgi:TonB family protein